MVVQSRTVDGERTCVRACEDCPSPPSPFTSLDNDVFPTKNMLRRQWFHSLEFTRLVCIPALFLIFPQTIHGALPAKSQSRTLARDRGQSWFKRARYS